MIPELKLNVLFIVNFVPAWTISVKPFIFKSLSSAMKNFCSCIFCKYIKYINPYDKFGTGLTNNLILNNPPNLFFNKESLGSLNIYLIFEYLTA